MTTLAMERTNTVSDVIKVFKPRIALSIMLSAIGGVAVAQGTMPEAWRLAALAIAVFLAAGSAGAFNQWAEADLDGTMRRTANRPFVTGQFTAGPAWLAAILGVLAVSILMAGLATNWWAAFYTFLGAFTYGVVYTIWLKRRSWTNIIIGGLAGSFAVLAGAAAVNPVIGIEAALLTAVLFLWTPPHFWSLAMVARDDYARAGVPMLPLITGDKICARVILGHTLLLSVLSLVPALYGMGTIYLVGAIAGGALFTGTSIRLVWNPTRKNALANFLASLFQLCVLLTGAMADRAFGGF